LLYQSSLTKQVLIQQSQRFPVVSCFNNLIALLRSIYCCYAIPRQFHLFEPNPIERLLLPIPAILSKSTAPSQFKLPQKLKSTKVERLFQCHPEGHYLSQKAIADAAPSLKVINRKLYKALERQLDRIEDFFYECFFPTNLSPSSPAHSALIRISQLNFHSFKTRLDLGVSIATDDTCTATKQFRMAVQSTFAPSLINSNL
jgi:hypothetical protein